MSRAAVAYSYRDLAEVQPGPTGGRETRDFRVLGWEGTTYPGNTGRQTRLQPIRVALQQAPSAWSDEPALAGYFVQPVVAARPVHPRKIGIWGVGLAVALVVILAAGNAVTARGSTLSFSGYREYRAESAAPAPAPEAPAPPVVDAASSSAQPEPVAKPVPSGDYSLIGPPSLSVNQIEKVLKQYGSPAGGKGQQLFDLGVKFGIDPAYALAFFVHESGCGTKGVARFSKSIGNIRWTEGYGNYEGYRSYETWEQGMEDWYKLITDLYIDGWGLRTVDAIIPVYAPWGDNNHPPTYIASVKNLVDSWRGK